MERIRRVERMKTRVWPDRSESALTHSTCPKPDQILTKLMISKGRSSEFRSRPARAREGGKIVKFRSTFAKSDEREDQRNSLERPSSPILWPDFAKFQFRARFADFDLVWSCSSQNWPEFDFEGTSFSACFVELVSCVVLGN